MLRRNEEMHENQSRIDNQMNMTSRFNTVVKIFCVIPGCINRDVSSMSARNLLLFVLGVDFLLLTYWMSMLSASLAPWVVLCSWHSNHQEDIEISWYPVLSLPRKKKLSVIF